MGVYLASKYFIIILVFQFKIWSNLWFLESKLVKIHQNFGFSVQNLSECIKILVFKFKMCQNFDFSVKIGQKIGF